MELRSGIETLLEEEILAPHARREANQDDGDDEDVELEDDDDELDDAEFDEDDEEFFDDDEDDEDA